MREWLVILINTPCRPERSEGPRPYWSDLSDEILHFVQNDSVKADQYPSHRQTGESGGRNLTIHNLQSTIYNRGNLHDPSSD